MSEKENLEPVDETNAQRFKRIASRRLNNVLEALEVLSNCSGKAYEYTPEQVDKIEKHLTEKVAHVLAKFRGTAKAETQDDLL